MTYCCAIKTQAGMVFLSDSRTNAGADAVSTFRKMTIYEKPGERFMVMLSAGNLSISQSVREVLPTESIRDDESGEAITLWNARSLYDAARVLGSAVRRIEQRDGAALHKAGVSFDITLIFGGQIAGEPMRLFLIYAPGNFIEATDATPFFQIGQCDFGKPMLDRVITPDTPLDEAAKCALVSMSSTIKSNLTVGLPLDLVVYEAGRLQSDRVVCIDRHNPYYTMLDESWGLRLREVFDSIEDPQWGNGRTKVPIKKASARHPVLRKTAPPDEPPS